jgi:hypothetical protein
MTVSSDRGYSVIVSGRRFYIHLATVAVLGFYVAQAVVQVVVF